MDPFTALTQARAETLCSRAEGLEEGAPEAAIGYLGEALALSQQVGDRLGVITALHRLGRTYRTLAYQSQGDYSSALELLREARRLTDAEPEAWGERALIYVDLASVELLCGHHNHAAGLLAPARRWAEEVGDRDLIRRARMLRIGTRLHRMTDPLALPAVAQAILGGAYRPLGYHPGRQPVLAEYPTDDPVEAPPEPPTLFGPDQ